MNREFFNQIEFRGKGPPHFQFGSGSEAVVLLPNGYALSIQQNIPVPTSEDELDLMRIFATQNIPDEETPFEVAILAPLSDGTLRINKGALHQIVGKFPDEVLRDQTPADIDALLEKLAQLPEHKNNRADIGVLNMSCHAQPLEVPTGPQVA